MANTYAQIFIQTVFAVKYRQSLIATSWKNDLHAVIGNLINQNGCQTIIVNGVEDHVHCLFKLKPSYSVSEVMKNTKAKSSKWVNDTRNLNHRFEWQSGFGCFSYSSSQIEKVKKYILNQEVRHSKSSFKDEYLRFLKNFQIEYDEKYIFNEPI